MEIDSTVTAESPQSPPLPTPHEALGDLERLDRPIPEGSDICLRADNIGRLHFYTRLYHCIIPKFQRLLTCREQSVARVMHLCEDFIKEQSSCETRCLSFKYE